MDRVVIGSKSKQITSGTKTQLVNYTGKDKNNTYSAPLYGLSFTPFNDCTVIINEGEDVLIPAGSTLIFEKDEKITSFIINELDIEYIWLASI